MQWLGMSHACSSQSLTIVTAYDTLGASGVEHSLVQSKAKAMYIDPHLTKVAAQALKSAKDVKTVIYNNHSNVPFKDKDLEEFKKSHPDLRVLSFEEVRKLGEDSPVSPNPPKADDMFCIMYTSGTTGPPKGVPFSHSAIVAAVAGAWSCVEETVWHEDCILCYLPLAHM
jgi:long-chain acyl-CoA synthetase